MKNVLFLLLCLLLATSSAFAQSRQKTKTQTNIKTETEAESTDFEVIQKAQHTERGPGIAYYDPRTGRPVPGYSHLSYRVTIKALSDNIVMYSVNYGKKSVKTDNKTILTPFETYHYGCKSEMVAVPSGDFSKIKIVFEYKKNGKRKRFVVTNLERTSYNAP